MIDAKGGNVKQQCLGRIGQNIQLSAPSLESVLGQPGEKEGCSQGAPHCDSRYEFDASPATPQRQQGTTRTCAHSPTSGLSNVGSGLAWPSPSYQEL